MSRFFGGLYPSFVTLFRSISNGLTWGEAADALESLDNGIFWSSLFHFYVAFCIPAEQLAVHTVRVQFINIYFSSLFCPICGCASRQMFFSTGLSRCPRFSRPSLSSRDTSLRTYAILWICRVILWVLSVLGAWKSPRAFLGSFAVLNVMTGRPGLDVVQGGCFAHVFFLFNSLHAINLYTTF